MNAKTINQSWNIPDSVRQRQGDIWADIDFEINPNFSTHSFKNNPFDTKVGRILVCGKKFIVTYKELLRANSSIEQQLVDIFFKKLGKEEQVEVSMLNNTLYLRKNELRRLSETLDDSITTIQRSYKIGLYL